MVVQHQQYHVMLKFKIQGEIFTLKTLLDTGVDINVLNKKLIRAKYWAKARREVIRLGTKEYKFQYEVPKATICLENYHINIDEGLRIDIAIRKIEDLRK